jgi:ABC-type multidrug transport system fused ATPase/permease subunit
VIPQDPILMAGTVRANLDPFDQHSEAEAAEALRKVELQPEMLTAEVV